MLSWCLEPRTRLRFMPVVDNCVLSERAIAHLAKAGSLCVTTGTYHNAYDIVPVAELASYVVDKIAKGLDMSFMSAYPAETEQHAFAMKAELERDQIWASSLD